MPNFKRFLNYNLMPNTFDACTPVKRLKSSKHLEFFRLKKNLHSSGCNLQTNANPLGREVHKRICQRSVFRATEIRVEIYRTWGPFPRSSCLKRLYRSPKEKVMAKGILMSGESGKVSSWVDSIDDLHYDWHFWRENVIVSLRHCWGFFPLPWQIQGRLHDILYLLSTLDTKSKIMSKSLKKKFHHPLCTGFWLAFCILETSLAFIC